MTTWRNLCRYLPSLSFGEPTFPLGWKNPMATATPKTTLFQLIAAVAASLVGLAPLRAQPGTPATGTVSVTWDFLSFRGPYRTMGDVNNPSTLFALSSEVNGASPSFTGGAVPDASVSPRGLALGQAALSPTNAVEFVWSLAGSTAGFASNELRFTPETGFTATSGTPFRLGTLSFTNGSWFGASPNDPLRNVPSFFDFRITTASNNQPAFNQTFEGFITLVVHSAASTGVTAGSPGFAEAEADWIYIQGANTAGSGATGQLQTTNAFRVFDGSTSSVGTVELWAQFGSLSLLDFRNPTGDGFVTSSIAPLGSTVVPEPGSGMLLVAGFGGLLLAFRRRSVQT